MSVDIVEFLRARLDDDADRISSSMWTGSRARREVEAKRRIIQEHLHFGPDQWNPRYCIRCGPIIHGTECMTLRTLGGVYADHPDYRQEWKPEPWDDDTAGRRCECGTDPRFLVLDTCPVHGDKRYR